MANIRQYQVPLQKYMAMMELQVALLLNINKYHIDNVINTKYYLNLINDKIPKFKS